MPSQSSVFLVARNKWHLGLLDDLKAVSLHGTSFSRAIAD